MRKLKHLKWAAPLAALVLVLSCDTGSTTVTPPPPPGPEEVRVVIQSVFCPRTYMGLDEGSGNTWLVDDDGYLALGRRVAVPNPNQGLATAYWYKVRHAQGRYALRNAYTGRYLNVYGITRGTDGATLPASQPRVSEFVDDDSFFWVFYPSLAGAYNILSYTSVRNAATDGANARAGALSNYGGFDTGGNRDGYPASQTWNEFYSAPCYLLFYYHHVQWRFDAGDWIARLDTELSYLFVVLEVE
ncbi:MAG: RICIN domain-containing protein [Treponema sp.]|nr:RICIN domain-containing protein [Treponema sp.]